METIKTKEAKKEVRYEGYFLMDSGLKVPFYISEEDGGENFSLSLYGNVEFPFEKDDVIWLGEDSNLILRADKVVGWEIDKYESEK